MLQIKLAAEFQVWSRHLLENESPNPKWYLDMGHWEIISLEGVMRVVQDPSLQEETPEGLGYIGSVGQVGDRWVPSEVMSWNLFTIISINYVLILFNF